MYTILTSGGTYYARSPAHPRAARRGCRRRAACGARPTLDLKRRGHDEVHRRRPHLAERHARADRRRNRRCENQYVRADGQPRYALGRNDGADAGRLALAAMVAGRIDDRLAAHDEKRGRRDRDHRRARRIAARADGGGSLRTQLHVVCRRPSHRCRRNDARHGVERLARPLDDAGERLPQHRTAPAQPLRHRRRNQKRTRAYKG